MSPNTTPSAATTRVAWVLEGLGVTGIGTPARCAGFPPPGRSAGGARSGSHGNGDAELDAALGFDMEVVGQRACVALQRHEQVAAPTRHAAVLGRFDLGVGIEERRVVLIEGETERFARAEDRPARS